MKPECPDCGGSHNVASGWPCRACGETRQCQLANYEAWQLCDTCAEDNELCEDCHFPLEDDGECPKCGPSRPFDDPGPMEICGGMQPVIRRRR